MSQISQPVRIILIAGVVFLAAWFTVLRPKAETIEPTTTTTTAAPPTTGPGKAVEAAREAARKAAGQTTTEPSTKPDAATTTAPDAKPETPPAVVIPAEALAALPTDVVKALEAKKTLVLAVLADDAKPWRPVADDERYVRNSLKKVNRYDGDVFVKQVPANTLSTYGSLVNDLGVNQTPSIVVIDANLKGKVLTGYVDRIAINQAIADARDAGVEPDISDSYLRQLNTICGDYDLRIERWSRPTIRGKKALVAAAKRQLAIVRTYRRSLARSHAPTKYRSLKKQMLKVLAAHDRTGVAVIKAIKSGKAADRKAAENLYDAADWTALDRRFDKLGLTDCALNRRS